MVVHMVVMLRVLLGVPKWTRQREGHIVMILFYSRCGRARTRFMAAWDSTYSAPYTPSIALSVLQARKEPGAPHNSGTLNGPGVELYRNCGV
jgi:hypothetical protein